MENGYITENLNTVLFILAGVLTLVEAVLRWGIPAFRKNPANAGTVETIDSLWVAMVVALSLKAVLLQPFTIPSGSMEDTLLIGDYILVNKFDYGYSLFNKTPRFLEFKKPQRGDILVFVFPKDHSKDFIKRCRGVGGDVLVCKDKVLYVNGVKQDEPFVKHIDPHVDSPKDYFPDDPNRPLYGSRDNFGPVTVEAGHYFMMGDNRDNSLDSRFWGQLDEKLIKGKAWVIYYHSVGMATFLALVAAGAAVVSVFLLLPLIFGKSAGPEADPMAAETASSKKFLIILVLSGSLAAAGLIFWMGADNFKLNLSILKDRVFTVVK